MKATVESTLEATFADISVMEGIRHNPIPVLVDEFRIYCAAPLIVLPL